MQRNILERKNFATVFENKHDDDDDDNDDGDDDDDDDDDDR